jgi:murein DD-endopeptidase MepM/ murein hydrolase activator NlpD
MKNSNSKFLKVVSAVLIVFNFTLFTFTFALSSTEDDLRSLGVDEKTIRDIVNQTELNKDIKSIDTAIKAKRDEIEKAKKQSQDYEDAIAKKQKEVNSLQAQIELLDSRIAKAKLDLELTENDIEATELEIGGLTLKIEDKQKEISVNQQQIGDLLIEMQRHFHKSPLEIIFSNSSFSDFFDEIAALMKLSDELSGLLKRIQLVKQGLEIQRTELQTKKNELDALRRKLEGDRQALTEEQNSKTSILDQTKQSESLFQNLLVEMRAEEAQTESEIGSLEESLRAKLEARGQITSEDISLDWPVPNQGINTYFHDPTYLFRNIFEHPGLDLRTLKNGHSSNGMPVRAAEKGYVGRAKDAGMGYSYVMILHNKGFSSVYGHLSKILVNEGDFVLKGQIIALSGGLPGTPGAGRLTTGPHLHFELRINGIPVDPLPYLP